MIKTNREIVEFEGDFITIKAELTVTLRAFYLYAKNKHGEERAKQDFKEVCDRAFLTDEELGKEADEIKEELKATVKEILGAFSEE